VTSESGISQVDERATVCFCDDVIAGIPPPSCMWTCLVGLPTQSLQCAEAHLGLHVKSLLLSDFKQNGSMSINVRKNSQHQISWKCDQVFPSYYNRFYIHTHSDIQTSIAKLIGSILRLLFATNTPETEILTKWIISVWNKVDDSEATEFDVLILLTLSHQQR
jgi:hypothetical protein